MTFSDLALGVILVKSKGVWGALNEGTLELKSHDSYMILLTETFMGRLQDEKGAADDCRADCCPSVASLNSH